MIIIILYVYGNLPPNKYVLSEMILDGIVMLGLQLYDYYRR